MAKRRLDLSNDSDIEEIRNLLAVKDDDDPAQTEDLGEESDVASEDGIEENEGDTVTEQECSDKSEDEEDYDTEEEGAPFVLGKDKTTKWTRKPPNIVKRRGPENIITRLPGVIQAARQARTPVECWSNLFSYSVLEMLVKHTNKYIDSVKDKFSRSRDIRETDLIEIKAFLGLLYLAGAFKGNRQNLEELWGRENDGIEKFSLVMSLRRFKTLIRCLRFDDRDTRTQRKQFDRLCPIREIFEMFVENCQKSYCLGENVTIDEMLPGFRGRCPFRQCIPSKPNKYGIKLFALVDSKMTYTYNLEVYAGLQPEGPFRISNKPPDVVKRMVQPLRGSGRNITADNWFTDLELVDWLKKEKLTYVGTIRKNKRQLPPTFVSVIGRKQYSSMFGFSDGKTLVSYIPKERKNVMLISTLHNDHALDPSSGQSNKPEIITYYNSTKGGVDTADQMCSTYDVSRNNKRWPMVIFYAMMNVAGINSLIIYLGNELEPMRRRVFLKKLAHELTLPELQRRSQKTLGIPNSLQIRLRKFNPNKASAADADADAPLLKRRRCEPCTLEVGFRRMTVSRCVRCSKAICTKHSKQICEECKLVVVQTSSEVPQSSDSED